MLVHIVVWKYSETISRETREEHVARLRALKGLIPEIVSLEVGSDVLGLERSYDTGLVATFHDLEGLNVYTEHEAHQSVAGMGKSISSHVASVDFTV